MIGDLATAVREVLSAFGVNVSRFEARESEMHHVEGTLCIIIGLVEGKGERRGIIGFEFDREVASFLAGLMIGDPEGLFSEMGLSALSELAIMVCGTFLGHLDLPLLATPPTGVFGTRVLGLLNVMPARKVALRVGEGTLMVSLSFS